MKSIKTNKNMTMPEVLFEIHLVIAKAMLAHPDCKFRSVALIFGEKNNIAEIKVEKEKYKGTWLFYNEELNIMPETVEDKKIIKMILGLINYIVII